MTEKYNKISEFLSAHALAFTAVYLMIYLLWFGILEKYSQPVITLHSRIDDIIPYEPKLVIPYLLWFPYILVTFVWMYLKDRKEYMNMARFIFTGCIISLIIYTILPNGVSLRPSYAGNTLCGRICAYLYSSDTPTNVCPSLHVFVSVAMLSIIERCVSLREKYDARFVAAVLTVSIVFSVMFIKQHSVIDVLCGLLLALILYPLSKQETVLKFTGMADKKMAEYTKKKKRIYR